MTSAAEDVRDELANDWDASNTSNIAPDVIRPAEKKRVRTPTKDEVQVRVRPSDPSEREYAGIGAVERNVVEYVDVIVVSRDDTLTDDGVDEAIRVLDEHRKTGFGEYDRVDTNGPQNDLAPDRTKIYKVRQRVQLYKDARTITT
jgi:hypothetical protein